MNYLYFSDTENSEYPVALLVSTIRKDEVQRAYIDPFALAKEDVLVMDLHYSQVVKKTPVKEMRLYLEEEIIPVLLNAGTKVVAVADADYFKALTHQAKAEPHLGYAMDCPYGDFKVVYVPSYRAMFYDPVKIKDKIDRGMTAIIDLLMGTYTAPGKDIIHFEAYPTSLADIESWLNKLLAMNKPLTVDIEGFDLKHDKAGIGSICFCWSKHEGISFPVDYLPIAGATEAPFGLNQRNEAVRALLKAFFIRLSSKAIYHNIAFDVYVLIYQLFMKDTLDTAGLLEGLDVMLKIWDCTKLVSYLATNSCAGNKLGLKDQSQEYAGSYSVGDDIEDITRIPLDKLLKYNLTDGLATWYVHEKHYGTLVKDQQEDIYTNIFKPATVDIVQMQLTGLPINMARVREVKQILQKDSNDALLKIASSNPVQQFTYKLNEKWVQTRNSVLKVKRVTLADAKEVFNPSSGPQLQALLYDMLGLPVIKKTKSKKPSVSGDTLKALRHHTANSDIHAFLDAMIAFKAVDKMLTSFIPAFEGAVLGKDGWYYLYGNFNLGGTVSGRLSSSKPNLQNLPANSIYAKLIKSCIEAPPGWIFVGLDFLSLEDRISALTTKDPNKIKVYTDGYDGHSLRAFAYFGDQMPDIVDTVASINSIQTKYKVFRGDSKAPTFALTYQGTWVTLVTNCGFTEVFAKMVEKRYHELYVVSDKWVADKLKEASKTGYVTVAFGLRVRTPMLHQVLLGNSRTPYEAEAEGRTAGNALGQSWCLLNSRAGSEFMAKVRKSKHRLNIRPCAQIHDASYYLIKDDIETVMFCNEHLVKAVQWQDHPDIAHPDVKLGGNLGLFFPNWCHEAELPNGASEAEIRQIVEAHVMALVE